MKVTGGSIVYALGSDDETAPSNDKFTESIPTATGAGIYYIWYKAEADKNYNSTTAAAVKAEIAKAEITIKADDKTSAYGEALKELTWTIGGA